MRILLIEDDAALCGVLAPALQAAGLAADCCRSGAEGLALLRTGCYDACILDRMLPELDGLAVLRRARAGGVKTPVLMLTALGQVGDRVAGLDAGADDYLTKPFDTRELLARLRALARRPAAFAADAHRIACGDLVLDTAQLRLTGPSAAVTVSRRECDLLAALCRAPGTLRPRAVLLPKWKTRAWTVISVSSAAVWLPWAAARSSAPCAAWATAWMWRAAPMLETLRRRLTALFSLLTAAVLAAALAVTCRRAQNEYAAAADLLSRIPSPKAALCGTAGWRGRKPPGGLSFPSRITANRWPFPAAGPHRTPAAP